VNPHGEFEIAGYVVEPYTSEGRVVAEWLVELGGEFSDLFCVGESSPEVDRELRRVHVGFKRTSKNLRSTGYDLDGSSASTLD
jgi:hypothetical protein